MSSRKPEVLAAEGNLAHVYSALSAGADALYIGIKGLSARPDAWSFDLGQAHEAAKVVHGAGKRLYYAINAGFAEASKATADKLLNKLTPQHCNALIIGDWGLLKRVARLQVPIALHGSSLLGVYNPAAIELLQEFGVTRTVFNTNLYLDEMVETMRICPDMEYELIAYGGTCLYDQCRCQLKHSVDSEGVFHTSCDYIICRDTGVGLNKCDLDLTPTLALYIQLGFASFKIEGRTRPMEYIVQSTTKLRTAVDLYLQNPPKTYLPHYIAQQDKRGHL